MFAATVTTTSHQGKCEGINNAFFSTLIGAGAAHLPVASDIASTLILHRRYNAHAPPTAQQ